MAQKPPEGKCFSPALPARVLAGRREVLQARARVSTKKRSTTSRRPLA